MPRDIPNEVVMARLGIQVAVVALESLFEKMSALPRGQKAVVSAEVAEACERLKAAQALLAQLEDATGEDE
jgi:hypothetical protein